MFGLEIGFDKPGYLALLAALLPFLWWFSFRGLAGLGPTRRLIALGLRTAVLTLIVMCLAEVQWRRTSDKVTVIYLLDQSESIPLVQRQAMLRYVVEAVETHRRKPREDRAGVIVFGRDAKIEIPPFDDDVPLLGGLDSYVNLNTDATNLEAALKLAQASFTEDSAKRIVVVTDGNENVGDARSIAKMLADDGIGIDVAPVRLQARAEVAVEKVTMPSDARRGQPIESRIILNNYSDHPIPGKLRVTRRRVGDPDELLGEMDVVAAPGKTPFTIPHQIDQPAVYTYQADFAPTDPRDDLMSQNNRATAYTHVRGKGRVLVIESFEHPGDFDFLIDRLRESNIEVDVMPSDQLFTNLAELQGYDCVVLANVPRSGGLDADAVSNFSDTQIEMLVRNTEQMGCGLVMLGGEDAFGAGGWNNTELEKAMPVDFRIENSKIRAVGALALMMHASELAEGNFWQKEVARVAIEALGPMDYCGLVHWDVAGDTWLWGAPKGLIRVQGNRNLMLARLSRMQPGDMPEFEPAMKLALTGLTPIPASVKHMVIISDGDPSPPGFGVVNGFVQAGITVSTVAVGTHGPAGHRTLQDLANATGGRYYVVKNPRALPKIYQSETRMVSRPLIYESDEPMRPIITGSSHEILQGVDQLPPITGYVMTTVKENPLVEVVAIALQPAHERNATLMATWTYGLGRAAVVTTDAGKRWASAWTDWENYEKLYTQLIRWSMRPIDDQGKFNVSTDVKDGKVRVVITAMDKDDEFLNFLDMSSVAIDPKLQSRAIKVEQVAPGRYVGELEATENGNYFVTVNPGAGYAPLLTGVNVPYSSEFRDRETNMALLRQLAELRPSGGQPGALIEGDLNSEDVSELVKIDTYRPGLAPAVSSQDVWPLFVLVCAGVFFADVFTRRVTIPWDWVGPLWASIRRRLFGADATPEHAERLEQLRSRKAAVAEELDERRAARRFEPEIASDAPVPSLDEAIREESAPSGPARPAASELSPDAPDQESYTSRLLKAKKQAWRDRPEGK